MIRALILIAFLSCSSLSCAGDYSRDAFRHWIDADGDGENSRVEAIHTATVTGIVCPYTGELVTDTGILDIDHVIPLKWAWGHGAESWTADKREQFANDPMNLLPVIAAVNRSKGAKGPDEWLPPNGRFIPEYCRSWMNVCAKYKLDCDEHLLLEISGKYFETRNGIRP